MDNGKKRVVIIGSGIVGSAIAYELSKIPQLHITLIDESIPASGATGAALGVLMGIISQKTRGRAWELRNISIQRYHTLIPELQSLTGIPIPYNSQGILLLLFQQQDLEKYRHLSNIRHQQGWDLEIWTPSELRKYCPHLTPNLLGAVYSKSDLQVNPTILTKSLVAAATIAGVQCLFATPVREIVMDSQHCYGINTERGMLGLDWLIIAAGNGTRLLTQHKIDVRPVLGQALQLYAPSLGKPEFQPVITGEDVHLVPIGKGEYWLGATVEFPNEMGNIIPNDWLLTQVQRQAIAFCPSLASARIISTWRGERPRPQAESAPIIKKLPEYQNILVATGHYRNGILLAPATALAIKEMLLEQL